MSVMYSVWLNMNYFVFVIIFIITCTCILILFFFKAKIRIFGEWNPADREQVCSIFWSQIIITRKYFSMHMHQYLIFRNYITTLHFAACTRTWSNTWMPRLSCIPSTTSLSPWSGFDIRFCISVSWKILNIMGSVGIKWRQIKNYAYFQIKYGSNYIIGKKW